MKGHIKKYKEIKKYREPKYNNKTFIKKYKASKQNNKFIKKKGDLKMVDDVRKAGLMGIGIVLLVAFLFVICPFLLFGLGYFTGWLAKITIGGWLVKAINMTFGCAITKSMLPWIGGALAWIGSFFKSTINTNSLNKND